jgi:hypothetical protein
LFGGGVLRSVGNEDHHQNIRQSYGRGLPTDHKAENLKEPEIHQAPTNDHLGD